MSQLAPRGWPAAGAAAANAGPAFRRRTDGSMTGARAPASLYRLKPLPEAAQNGRKRGGADVAAWNAKKTVIPREEMPEHHRLTLTLSSPHLVRLNTQD